MSVFDIFGIHRQSLLFSIESLIIQPSNYTVRKKGRVMKTATKFASLAMVAIDARRQDKLSLNLISQTR